VSRARRSRIAIALLAVGMGASILGLGASWVLAAQVAPVATESTPAGDPRAVVGAPRGRALTGAELDAHTKAVASLLRCPVCQGLSVADSPSTTAQKMKGQVREMLAVGYDQDQILAYFETSYGAFVRLEPPLRGVNWLVWLAPVLGLAAGGGVVAWALRGPRREPAAAVAPTRPPANDAGEPVPDRDTLPEDSRLAAYVLRVREAVYGWPGGRSPAGASAPPRAASS
jgi:cytochrome c-type biogenesis protein CcmH